MGSTDGFIGRVLRGVQGNGGNWGNPKDSYREDWGTLGKIRGITTTPLGILLYLVFFGGGIDSMELLSFFVKMTGSIYFMANEINPEI